MEGGDNQDNSCFLNGFLKRYSYIMENLQPKRSKLQSTLSNRIKTVSSIVNKHFVSNN